MFRTLLVRIVFLSCCLTPMSALAQGSGLAVTKTADLGPASVRPFDPAGSLILVGGGSVTPEIRKRIAAAGRAGQPKSCLVIFPTSSEAADQEPADYWKEPWLDFGFASLEVMHTRDRSVAETVEFNEPLTRATAVWVSGGDQSRFTAAYAGTRTETMLQQVLARGGVVSGTSAGAAMASRVMIAEGQDDPVMGTGLDLLPDGIVDQHFANRNRLGRLQKAVAEHRYCVGIGIDEATAAIFHRRSLTILGEGNVRVMMAATDFFPAQTQLLKPGTLWLDWTTLVRQARERALPPFPPAQPERLLESPSVAHGALLIVGGGKIAPSIWQTFVERAGGEEARIVVLPTATPNPVADPFEARMFRKLGVKQVTVLPEMDRQKVDRSENLEPLESATGIWFGGGRQWRFVDSYEGTKALQAMHRCLARGGIIGGSSAGASIQGQLLIRGAPVGNHIMVQDGYRRGFGFLPGVGIDQHFSQRNRLPDLTQVIREFPAVLGLGIDEETAILVEKSKARVIGTGRLFAVQMPRSSSKGQIDPRDAGIHEQEPRIVPAGAGQVLDLVTLDVVSEK